MNNSLCKYFIFSLIIFSILKFIPNIKLNYKDILILTILLMLIIIFFDINKNNKKCKVINEGMTNITNNNDNLILTYNNDKINELINNLSENEFNNSFQNYTNDIVNHIIKNLNDNNKNKLIKSLNNDNLTNLLNNLNNDNLNEFVKSISKENKKIIFDIYFFDDLKLMIFIDKLNQENVNIFITELYDEFFIKLINKNDVINNLIPLLNKKTNDLIINKLNNDDLTLFINNLSENNVNFIFNNLSKELIEKIFNDTKNYKLMNLLNNDNLNKVKSIIKPEQLNKLKENNDININNIFKYLNDDIKYDDINKYIEIVNIAKYNPLYTKAILNRSKIDNEFNVLIRLIETDKNKVLDLSKNNKLKSVVNEIMEEKKTDLNKEFVNNNNEEEMKTKKYIDNLFGKNKYFDNNGFVKNVLDTDLKYSQLSIDQMEKLGEYDNTFTNNWQNDYILLNTDKWRPPINNQYKVKCEKTCPVCPSLTKGYPVNVREFNNSKKILPPDNISVDYIIDKLNK